MAKPWTTLDSVATDDGVLELRKRDEHDFLILVDGRVLMNSVANRSELALGKIACRNLKAKRGARVVVGGLGMGYTLRAVLDSLADDARVTVAELNPVVLGWCEGSIAHLTAGAANDPRATVEITNVAKLIARLAAEERGAVDAIVLDLYLGPNADCDAVNDPLYGSIAIRNAFDALAPGAVLAVWGESFDPGYDKRLRRAGFAVSNERPGKGGLRHIVYLATKRADGKKVGSGSTGSVKAGGTPKDRFSRKSATRSRPARRTKAH
jgi:spermidine synthase